METGRWDTEGAVRLGSAKHQEPFGRERQTTFGWGGAPEPRRFLGGWAAPMTKGRDAPDARNGPGAGPGPRAAEPPRGWAGEPCSGSPRGGWGLRQPWGRGRGVLAVAKEGLTPTAPASSSSSPSPSHKSSACWMWPCPPPPPKWE